MGEEEKKAEAPPVDDKDKDKDTLPKDQLNNGPVNDRSCTDILCCLIFVAFFVGMVGACGYGYLYGNPVLLTTPWDGDALGCGLNVTREDYPYLYFPMIDYKKANEALKNAQGAKSEEGAEDAAFAGIAALMKFGVCVKTCPRYNKNATDNLNPQCQPIKAMHTDANYKDCIYHFGGPDNGVAFRYDTERMAGKFCLPSAAAMEQIGEKVIEEFSGEFSKYFGDTGFMVYMQDIMHCKDVLFIAFGTAFLVGFLYMIVLRVAGGPIIYLSILALILCTAAGGLMLHQEAATMVTKKEEQKKMYYTYGSYVVWGISAVLLCCALCNQKNIRIGVAVMKCTAMFIGGTPQVFLIPPVAIVVIMSWLTFWLIMALHVFSVGELKPNPKLPAISTVEWNDETRYVFLYILFGYLWLNAFIIGVTQFIISAACAIWYFSCTSDSNGSGSLSRGFYWVFRYHLGSIAFGSFLIALIQMIRIIFEYYKDQIQKANKDNKVVKILLMVTSYLLDCLERFIKFISKNAYIQIAITGKNFCAAAWNAFLLILKNAVRFGTANSIGFIFNVLGVCFIAAVNGLVVYAMLHYIPAYEGLTQDWIAPAVVGCLQGVLIGAMFMSVFSFASDTILQAFLVDEELGRPDGMRPAIMNQFIEGVEDKQGGDEKKEEPAAE